MGNKLQRSNDDRSSFFEEDEIKRDSELRTSTISQKRQTIVDKVSTSVVSPSTAPTWNYLKNGEDWSFQDSSCYKRQSPIDIQTKDVLPFEGNPLSIKFHNRITHFHMVDNGVTFVTDLTKVSDAIATLSGPDVEGVQNKYELLQFHFHAPAEHKIDSVPYDLELHFVFQFKGEAEKGPKDYLSVLGIIFKVVPEIKPQMPDGRFIKEFKCESLGKDLSLNFFHLHSIFKESEYYAYKGSLTAMPCLEIVNWYVHNTIFYITEEELKPFRERWIENQSFSSGCGNNRVCQPLLNRKVFKMKGPVEERFRPECANLKSGGKIPYLGFTIFNGQNIDTHHIQSAFKHGFLHIQTGHFNNDEISLGESLNQILQSGFIKRNELFISAVYELSQNITKNVNRTLEDLQSDYLDLVILERPKDRELDAENLSNTLERMGKCWRTLEDLVKAGKIKSLGISNFSSNLLKELISFTEIAPVVNEIEFHPFNQQRDVLALCKKHNIIPVAFGHSLPKFKEEIRRKEYEGKLDKLVKIATKKNKNVRQLILNWTKSQGVVPLLRPDDYNYLKEAVGFTEFTLNKDEIEEISAFNKKSETEYLRSTTHEI